MASKNKKLQILLAKRDNLSYLGKIKQGSQKIGNEVFSQDNTFVGMYIGVIS